MIRIQWAALLLVGLQLGCERQPQTNSLGPQTSPEAIIQAQNDSLSKLDPYQIRTGQTVHKVETQEVITNQGPMKNLSKEWVTRVTEVENSAEERLITTLKEVTDHPDETSFIYEFKNVFSLPQLDAIEVLNKIDADAYSPRAVAQALRSSESTSRKVTGVAFHNLITQKVELAPPQLVKSATHCKGLPDCRIQAEQISYDVVFQMDDQSTQTHTVEWYVSSQVPYFAGIIKQCATTLVPVESLHVLLKQCTEVVDFNVE